MKRFIAFLFLAMFLITLPQSLFAEAKKPTFISIGTAPTGASFYPMGVGMAQIIKKNVKGLNASAVPTGASKENINLLSKDEAQLGFVTSPTAYEAYNAVGEYKGKDPAPIRLVLVGHKAPYTLIARKDSGIKSYSDIKGKNIIADMPRASSNLNALMDIAQQYDVKRSDVNIAKLLSIKNAIQQVKEGRSDGVFYIVTPGSAAFIDLARNVDTSWPSVSKEKVDNILKEKKYYTNFKYKPGIFKGQDQPVEGIASAVLICTNKDVDDETIYNITKAFFENTDILKKSHPVGKQYTLKNAVSVRPIPFHPGAIKYYKEKGVW